MDIDDFIQAIIEEPDVDDHRLIFADYLEEHDDPRAELIRLQFQMREIGKSNSKWTSLRTKELKLLRKHGGFGEPPKIGKILSWHGGFVDEIETTLAQLATKNEELLAKTTVRGVQVRATSKQFKKLFDSPHLHRLRKLTFKNNHIPNHELCEFLAVDSLNLKELFIHNNEMNNDVGRTIGRMKHFDSLEKLDLYGGSISSITAKSLADSPYFNDLTSLSLGHSLDDEGVQHISTAKKFQSLTRLEMNGDFTNVAIHSLHNSTFYETLEDLKVRIGNQYEYQYTGNPIEFHLTEGFENPPPKLKSLEIGSGMPDATLIEIAKHYRGLETLDAGYNQFSDHGIEALAESELLSTLKRLVLTDNQITARGVDMLRNSKFWTGKTKVYLRSNNFTQAQSKAIKAKYGKTFGNLGPDWDHWF